MLPTLPGHGRAWRLPKGNRTGHVVDLGDGPITNGSDIDMDLRKVEDDIDDIPKDALPYQIFARSVGQLARQFKKEHPDGVLAVAGHSLGGAITARYAMEMPEVVDRVMLFNPMFGLNSLWVKTMTYLTPDMVLSKGSKCESQRGRGSGGTCHFKLAHVRAMAEFAYSMLCHRWGILEDRDCLESSEYLSVQLKFGQMKDFQVVTARGEDSVDNDMIAKFVNVVQRERTSIKGVAYDLYAEQEPKRDRTFCLWPAEMGHSYLSNRKTTSTPEKWWHPYVESVSAEFLASGTNVDIVRSGSVLGSMSDCVLSSLNVEGKYLTLLPAVAHRQMYELIGPIGFDVASVANVLFSSYVTKESHTWGKMNWRHLEILKFMRHELIVTRIHQTDNIRNIYVIRNDGFVELSKEDTIPCAKIKGEDVDIGVPLEDAILKANSRHNAGAKPRILKICGFAFVEAICPILGFNCEGQPLQRN